MPEINLLTLLDGVTISFLPTSLLGVFLLSICALESAVYDLSILSSSSGTICVKMSSNCIVPFFICYLRYCPVFTRVLYMSGVPYY